MKVTLARGEIGCRRHLFPHPVTALAETSAIAVAGAEALPVVILRTMIAITVAGVRHRLPVVGLLPVRHPHHRVVAPPLARHPRLLLAPGAGSNRAHRPHLPAESVPAPSSHRPEVNAMFQGLHHHTRHGHRLDMDATRAAARRLGPRRGLCRLCGVTARPTRGADR